MTMANKALIGALAALLALTAQASRASDCDGSRICRVRLTFKPDDSVVVSPGTLMLDTKDPSGTAADPRWRATWFIQPGSAFQFARNDGIFLKAGTQFKKACLNSKDDGDDATCVAAGAAQGFRWRVVNNADIAQDYCIVVTKMVSGEAHRYYYDPKIVNTFSLAARKKLMKLAQPQTIAGTKVTEKTPLPAKCKAQD